jgi:hypothetical protein
MRGEEAARPADHKVLPRVVAHVGLLEQLLPEQLLLLETRLAGPWSYICILGSALQWRDWSGPAATSAPGASLRSRT